jgi:ATP-binding cassette subfamily B protein/subfamily B ATP-binding cassette protein MsbA
VHSYGRLLAYARPYRRGWAAIIGVSLLSTTFALLQPWPLKVLVDHVLGDTPMTAAIAAVANWLPGAGTRIGLLGWVVAAGLGIFAVNSLADSILAIVWTKVGRGMVYDLARELFAHIQRRSLNFHSRHPVGDSMSRITGDVWCVHTVVDTLLFAPGQALFTMILMIVVMMRLDAGLTLLALTVAPLMSVIAWRFGRPMRRAAHTRREVESRIQSHVQQTLAGVSVVQAFAREDHEERRFHEYASFAIRAHQRSAFIGSAYGLASGLVTTLGTSVILWIAATRVLDGRLTIGATLVFLAYLGSLQRQLAAFTNIYTSLQAAGASIDRVMEVFDDDDRVRERPGAPPLPSARGEVVIDNVVFGYLPGHPVLRGVSLSARAGDTVAIVGATGAGKSTLMGLIPRLFDPAQGRVTIDGHDVRELQLSSLRDQVAVVLQEPFLMPLTVAENISFGKPGASRAEIIAAARTANAHQFIERLPAGYDSVLGERGATLSGGERQRLAIARAILKNAPILILDEPTSALDAETEHELLEAVERLMQGRTTFIIAHRLSTVRNATSIVVLDGGLVVEQGTHGQLLARGGRYSELHRLQFNRDRAEMTAA